jgi:hypothetical protein
MFVKSFCVTISLSGTDDIVARYTCFMFSLFAKQLIPNPTMLLLFYCLGWLFSSLTQCSMLLILQRKRVERVEFE